MRGLQNAQQYRRPDRANRGNLAGRFEALGVTCRPLAQDFLLSLLAMPLLDPEVVKPSVIVHISVTSSVPGHANSVILGRA
jgi:hypothetical protein